MRGGIRVWIRVSEFPITRYCHHHRRRPHHHRHHCSSLYPQAEARLAERFRLAGSGQQAAETKVAALEQVGSPEEIDCKVSQRSYTPPTPTLNPPLVQFPVMI